jgi:hypothetical protein
MNVVFSGDKDTQRPASPRRVGVSSMLDAICMMMQRRFIHCHDSIAYSRRLTAE